MIPRRIAFVAVVSYVVLASGPTGSAQSLGEVAKREAERRGTGPQSGKVYTNGDLTPDFTTPAPPPAAAAQDAAAAEEPAPGESTTVAPEGAAGDHTEEQSGPLSSKGEDYWRARAERIRNRIDKQRSQIEALQARVNALKGSNDPGTDQERTLAVRALDKARTNLGYLEDERANFEATAKAQRIPDAWIR